jgi:DNA-directed RNA polymerase specialized sigma54-like protein
MEQLSLRHEQRSVLRQELALRQRMLQSLELLQLPALELCGWLREAAESNEVLSYEEPSHPGPAEPEERRGSGRTGREATDRHDQFLQSIPDRSRSIAESVDEQLLLLDLPAALDSWVRLASRCLDEAGYLSLEGQDLLELGEREGLRGDLELVGQAVGCCAASSPRGSELPTRSRPCARSWTPRTPTTSCSCACWRSSSSPFPATRFLGSLEPFPSRSRT